MGVGVAPASAKKARTPAQYASPGLVLILSLILRVIAVVDVVVIMLCYGVLVWFGFRWLL